MKVLGIDPGAKRLGYACVTKENDEYKLLFSGVEGLDQGKLEWQAYRMELIKFWVERFYTLLMRTEHNGWAGKPIIYSEILPAVGGGNFAVATQDQLAKTAITACQTIAIERGYTWKQVAANTVKKDITGLKPKEATKIQVRNAVIRVFPELQPRKKTILADETDAIAIALVGLGYKHGTATDRDK